MALLDSSPDEGLSPAGKKEIEKRKIQKYKTVNRGGSDPILHQLQTGGELSCHIWVGGHLRIITPMTLLKQKVIGH